MYISAMDGAITHEDTVGAKCSWMSVIRHKSKGMRIYILFYRIPQYIHTKLEFSVEITHRKAGVESCRPQQL